MSKHLLVLWFIVGWQVCFSQEQPEKAVDSLYKEDQFYLGVTYNLIGNMPKDMSQNSFSLGFHLGFIKDMPISTNRNLALGLGLGYSSNTYNQNLLINKNADIVSYSLLTDNNKFTRNKFSNHLIEVPFELRWRQSNPTDNAFWRIYAGFKLGYVLSHKTKYKGDLGTFKYRDIKDFESLQYGITLSVGYHTWNVHVYYTLNSLFNNDAVLDGNQLDVNAIKIGLMFYIL